MKKIEEITKHQLKFLVHDCRKLINNHIIENEMSVHAFAKKCQVHPNQLYLFLNADRGLNLTTMQKIAKIISE
tara:strand:- start:6135 stop:6353 length:219 start_codon:yes stop_codon:yes gene_type:complete